MIDPIALFEDTLRRAQAACEPPVDPTACVLATADAQGRPSARVVLLKGVDERGFVFYTSRDSRKGQELATNPRAALCFHWPVLGEQVRVEGAVELVADEESDEYFASRPRESQLAAWASAQSRPISSRDDLMRRYHELEEHHAGRPVPRPPHWGGYRLIPDATEFWHHGAHRLHDRELFTRTVGGWAQTTLSP
jgi:pyridoxamine 5'-phosphate oxidase